MLKWVASRSAFCVNYEKRDFIISVQGKVMVHTIAAVLSVGLFSPIWDGYRLARQNMATVGVPGTAATNLQIRFVLQKSAWWLRSGNIDAALMNET